MFSNIRRGIKMNRKHGDIRPYIQRAQDNATAGDKIRVPSGIYSFTGTATINKFVSFQGHGKTQTVFYRPQSITDASLDSVAMLLLNINSDSSSNIVISDIGFTSKFPEILDLDGGSLAADHGIKIVNCMDFKVQRCRFQYFGTSAIEVIHKDDLASGLITQNEFYRNAKGDDGLGLGYGVAIYGANLQWVANPQLGSSNFIFIENNNFDYHRHSIAAGGCGLYVSRYNRVTNNNIGASSSIQAMDMHQANGGTLGTSNYFSSRASEIYENYIVNTTFKDNTQIIPGQPASRLVERAIRITGGESLVWNNTISGYRFGLGIGPTVFPFGTTYPIAYSHGYLSGLALGAGHTGNNMPEADGDIFYWGNNVDIYDINAAEFFNYYTTNIFVDRDYHNIAKPSYTPYTYPHPLT